VPAMRLSVHLEKLGRSWSWVSYGVLFLFIVLPLLVMAALLAIRADMFDVTGTPDAEQTRLFLTFIGGGLATAATVLGALFAWQHNNRERHRLGIQAVIESLGSMSVDAPPRVAGVLASMVLLGHPRVAIRMLAPAWQAHQVDPGTATWLIGQVLAPGKGQTNQLDGDRADPAAVEEAAVLLREHAAELTQSSPRSFDFPGYFQHAWRTEPELPEEARRQLLVAIGLMLASRDKDWWCPEGFPPRWPISVLAECANRDSEEDIKKSAAVLFCSLYCYFPHRIRASSLFRHDPRGLESILADGAEAEKNDDFQEFTSLAKQITEAWGPCEERLAD
jgi:hypothetical protein